MRSSLCRVHEQLHIFFVDSLDILALGTLRNNVFFLIIREWGKSRMFMKEF